jgi:hypothetical protein
MLSDTTRNLLKFLNDAVEEWDDDLPAARRFVRQIRHISDQERFILEQALESRERLRQYRSIFLQ